MNKKFEGYRIIREESDFELSRQVMYWIKNFGYEPLGGAFYDGKYYCQTIVLKVYNNEVD